MTPEQYLDVFFTARPSWADVVSDTGGLGLCHEAVLDLIELCPELHMVRGQIYMLEASDDDKQPWPHWWCVTNDGEVVDPTRDQFPGSIRYVPWNESLGPPRRKCLNCGSLSIEDFCAPECAAKTMKSLGLR